VPCQINLIYRSEYERESGKEFLLLLLRFLLGRPSRMHAYASPLALSFPLLILSRLIPRCIAHRLRSMERAAYDSRERRRIRRRRGRATDPQAKNAERVCKEDSILISFSRFPLSLCFPGLLPRDLIKKIRMPDKCNNIFFDIIKTQRKRQIQQSI